eukprot:8555044-Lingulodinium_polyedra.AAC.1
MVREEAKKQADEIRARHAAAAKPPVPPIYKVTDNLAIDSIAKIPVVSAVPTADLKADLYCSPFLAKGIPEVDMRLGAHAVQRGLTTWAASYQTKTGGNSMGRLQKAVESKAGKDETLKMLEQWTPANAIDLSG